jgi:hypothetical protein
MSKRQPKAGKAGRASALSRRAVQHAENNGIIVVNAEDAFAHSESVVWPENFPKDDDHIDLSDIPEQDFSGPDVVVGKYIELARLADRLSKQHRKTP